MALQATTTRTWTEIKAHHLLAAGLAVLVLTAIAVAASSQMSGNNSGPASMALRPAAASPTPPEVGPVYYIVSSEAQARSVFMLEEETARMRAENFDFGTQYQFEVFIATDDASLNQAVQRVVHENGIRYTAGLPEIQLVDLRPRAR